MIPRDPLEELEAELQRMKPAPPPEEFLRRLGRTPPPARRGAPDHPGRPAFRPWRDFLAALQGWPRWAFPAAALALAAIFIWRVATPADPSSPARHRPEPAGQAPLRADSLEVDRKLIASFDAIAELPGGEPVRLQCEEWVDAFVLRDETRGVTVEQRVPRFEIVRVSYETY